MVSRWLGVAAVFPECLEDARCWVFVLGVVGVCCDEEGKRVPLPVETLVDPGSADLGFSVAPCPR